MQMACCSDFSWRCDMAVHGHLQHYPQATGLSLQLLISEQAQGCSLIQRLSAAQLEHSGLGRVQHAVTGRVCDLSIIDDLPVSRAFSRIITRHSCTPSTNVPKMNSVLRRSPESKASVGIPTLHGIHQHDRLELSLRCSC